MRRIVGLALLLVAAWATTGAWGLSSGSVGSSAASAMAGAKRVIVLWPTGAPGAVGTRDADVPKLYMYPAATGTRSRARTAVIVLPGGGYRTLEMTKEGEAAARWLTARGVSAFVLQYRLSPRYRFPAPMLDGARAVRYVRSHAGELGIAPDHVGVWGFSAGGHLAGFLATVNDDGDPKAAEAIGRVSDRPDFAILSYARLSMDASIPRPMNLEALLGPHPSAEMLNMISVERHVTPWTSPCFLYATTADQTVNAMNTTAFYDALKRAGVPVEMHIFERGRHGSGMGQGLRAVPELAIWPMLLENWMRVHGWMD